jgi:transcription elongation factor Elf1
VTNTEDVDLSITDINYAISPQHHTPMYLMHKYWARKPHNVVAEYIQHYSEEGDIVLDPFCGSGVTIAEALKKKRKAIGVDLDPVATFITWMTIVPANLARFKEEYERVKNDVKQEIETLYLTRCPKCGQETPFHYIVYNKDVSQIIHLHCKNCKSVLDKELDEEDKKKNDEINQRKIPFWYPNNELIWNSRVNVPKGMTVADLFSKRNLLALSILYN